MINKQQTQLPTLIPREILYGNPSRTSPQVSPDGKYIAYIAPDDKNILQVWLGEIELEEAKKLTDDKKRGIMAFFWTYNPEQLIYLQDADGDENFHLYSVKLARSLGEETSPGSLVNINSNIIRDLTPFQGVKAQVIGLESEFPDEILVGLNLHNPQKFDVYRINLKNGAVEFDTDNPGNIMVWTADAKFKVSAAIAATPDGGHDLLYREATDKPWQTLRHWGPEEEGRLCGFSKDGQILYLVASHDANGVRLLALDLATKQETVIAEDSQYDVSRVILHPTERHVQAVLFYKEQLEWQVIDPSIAADVEAIALFTTWESLPKFSVIAPPKADL